MKVIDVKTSSYILLFILTFIGAMIGFSLLDSENEVSISLINYNDSELVLIYLADSRCPFCQNEEIINQIRGIDAELNEISKKMGFGYKKIGISIDWNVNEGLSYLRNIIEFDELIVGGGWSNMGVLRYVYDDFQTQAATPQLIITFRNYNRIITPSTETFRGLKEERVFVNLIGDEMLNETKFDEYLNQ